MNEYFILESDYNNYPLVKPEEGENIDYYYRMEKVKNPDPVLMYISKPYPENLVMADYHQPLNVFSTSFKDIIDQFKLDYIQFVSVIINGIKGELYQDYWLMNICKNIKCLDLNKSEYRSVDEDGMVSGLNKIFIDYKKIDKISLNERLLFILGETYSEIIVHKYIADIINSASLKGIKIYSLEDYYDGIQFE